MSNTVALILARGGSKRLPRKNIYPIFDVPMLAYTIAACKDSKHIGQIFVSTEDEEIKKVAREHGAEVIDRPEELAGDKVWNQPVLEHAVSEFERMGIPVDVVAHIQANSPMVETEKIDEAIEKILNPKRKIWEVFSMDEEGYENAAIHVFRKEVAFQKALSVYVAIVTTNYPDVHTLEDVKEVEKKWGKHLKARKKKIK